MPVKRVGYMLLFLIFMFALFGCSNETDSNNAQQGAENEGGSDSDANSEDVTDEAVSGGELNIAFNAQPPTLDIPQTTATAARDIAQHIFEPLVALDSSLEPQPMLAERYDISDDNTQITFHLRQGIKFHNGKEVTAEDVVASMERWQQLSSSAKTYLEGTKYEIEDEYTVVATRDKPTTLDMFVFADMSQFAAIMPKEIIDEAGLDNIDEYIGTGPYKMEDWRQDQYIHLSKYEDFQSRSEPADGLSGEKKALVDDMYFHFVGDSSTRVAGLKTGEYDISRDILQNDVELLDEDENIKTSIYPSSMLVLILNNKVGTFSDKKMRQAANAAINVEDILTAAYVSERFYVKDHALVKEEQTNWYTDAGSDVYNTYDPELAKELLDEAGYDGEEIVILTSREYDAHYNAAVVVQQHLEAVGMNVVLDVRDAPSSLELGNDENAYQIKSDSFAFRSTPIQQIFLNPDYQGWPDSEELERVKEEILYAESQEEAHALSAEFHEILWEDVPSIKVGNSTNIMSMRENIDGLQYIAGPILWNVSIND